MYRPITPEFRQKMSTIAKSTAFANPDLITDERRRRNSEWHKGRHLSEETKQKISKTSLGRSAPNKNKIAINKDGIIKMILKEDFETYLTDGWKRGRK